MRANYTGSATSKSIPLRKSSVTRPLIEDADREAKLGVCTFPPEGKIERQLGVCAWRGETQLWVLMGVGKGERESNPTRSDNAGLHTLMLVSREVTENEYKPYYYDVHDKYIVHRVHVRETLYFFS